MDFQMKQTLKMSYDQQARLRDGEVVQSWKAAEMGRFLTWLNRVDHEDGGKRILDLGSGPGHQASYLRNNGCQVTCVLKPDGFMYMGLYGGYESEGIWENDTYRPQRFFSFYEDEHIQEKVSEVFDIEQFAVLPMEGMQTDYQSIIARKKQLNP